MKYFLVKEKDTNIVIGEKSINSEMEILAEIPAKTVNNPMILILFLFQHEVHNMISFPQ